MYLSNLTWVFEKLERWLSNAATQEKEAMELFLNALNSTQQYLGRLQMDMSIANIDSEQELSDAWNAAALAVRKFDKDLYQRCLAKACHWSGSSEFKKSEISELNISLNKMINIAANRNCLVKKKTKD